MLVEASRCVANSIQTFEMFIRNHALSDKLMYSLGEIGDRLGITQSPKITLG